MKVIETSLPGVRLIEPDVLEDDRGYFLEAYSYRHYSKWSIRDRFVQDNMSFSRGGVIRGLHLQNPNPQAKIAYVVQGEVLDVAVDLRVGSPNFGRWVAIGLSYENKRRVYIPAGFAHAFCIVSETAFITIKCADSYHPENSIEVAWNDPDIGIEWPVKTPILSERDANAPRLKDIDPARLPRIDEL